MPIIHARTHVSDAHGRGGSMILLLNAVRCPDLRRGFHTSCRSKFRRRLIEAQPSWSQSQIPPCLYRSWKLELWICDCRPRRGIYCFYHSRRFCVSRCRLDLHTFSIQFSAFFVQTGLSPRLLDTLQDSPLKERDKYTAAEPSCHFVQAPFPLEDWLRRQESFGKKESQRIQPNNTEQRIFDAVTHLAYEGCLSWLEKIPSAEIYFLQTTKARLL